MPKISSAERGLELRIHAVVPLKEPTRGKSRLAGALAEAVRLRLIRSMLDHVVETIVRAPGIAAVSVLTSAAEALPRGAGHLPDRDEELNAALAGAARSVRASGAEAMLIVAADLPLVTTSEIVALIEASRDGIVAATDWTGTGTNALAFALAHEMPMRFGPASLAAHEAAARARGLPWRVVRRAGLSFDVDEPAQLDTLIRTGGERYAFLRSADGETERVHR